MIVEHVFITTLEAPEAIRLASQVLSSRGFVARAVAAIEVAAPGAVAGTPPRSAGLEMARGKASAARARSIDELPQRLRLDWDRGRVTVAACIEYFQHGSFNVGTQRDPAPDSPKVRSHVELMTAVVGALEMSLAHRVPVEEATRRWAEVENRLREESRRKRHRRNVILWSVLGGIVLLVVVIIVLNTR